MDVRLARPTDAPLVLALTLDEHAHLVRSPDWPAGRPILRSVARAMMPMVAPGRTWFARDGGSCALLEARPRRYVIGWDITRLAVRGDYSAVLPPVIDAVNQHLQNRGVPRLFARCQEGARADLEDLGFCALSREYILVGAPSELDHGDLPADSRYRMPQDSWPLHQLESEITPPLVRQLEGLTSLDWSQGARSVSEIVVEADGKVLAWIGWSRTATPGTFIVGLLLHPERNELASSLLGHVVEQAGPQARFVTRVRDYQPETLNALLAAGFDIVGEEILMVRHGRVALVPAERTRLRVARVPSIPAMPFRVVITGPRLGPTKEDNL